jgi:hypothetical protein
MDVISHHLTALYVLAACVIVPLVVLGGWRFLVRHQQRKAQQAMLRGNQLHRRWLEASKQMQEGAEGH